MKRETASIVVILLILLNLSVAYASEVEVNANQSTAEGRLLITRQSLSIGADILYNGDKYTIGSGILAFRNDQLIDRLKFAIGFRGMWGTIKRKPEDIDMSAAGFLISMAYDLPNIEVYYNVPLDFELVGELCMAPAPLCFGDGDGYTEMKAGLGLHVLGDRRGTLLVGYRTLEARFDETFNNWSMSDSAMFFGYKFNF